MKLTPKQIRELIEIIDRFTLVYIAEQIGLDILTQHDKDVLRRFGITPEKMQQFNTLEHAFKFGILSEALGHKASKAMNYAQFKDFLGSGKFIPLTEIEQEALNYTKLRSYSDIKGLGNKISNDLTTTIIESSKSQRRKYEKIIRTSAEDAIANRKQVRELVSDLGHKTQDWARDFGRIADYIMHEAFDTGRAMSVLKNYGPDAEVFKDVYEGACDTCRKLYLTGAIGSEPIVFKVSVLLANGSNIGRKAKEMKPVIGATHPWCRCTLNHKPKGSVWDATKRMFVLTKIKEGYSDRVANRRSTAKVTIVKD